MKESSLLFEGIGIGIWFTIFIILAIKSVNKMERESKRFYILEADLEWWQNVRNCFMRKV